MRIALALASLLLVASCSSEEEGAAPAAAPATIEPTLASIQENIFAKNCAFSACHNEQGAGGLSLASGKSLGSLVGVASKSSPGKTRVVAGKPEESVLYLSLLGDVGSATRMPQGGDPLSEAKINAIKQWIADGAKP